MSSIAIEPSLGPKRVIFFMWLQGIGSAPPVVRACYESWVRQNPDWKVVLLTASNIADYVALPNWSSKLSHAQMSDLVRLKLMDVHGGVWADATTFCNWPLRDWIPEVSAGGFFAFAWPARGYLLSSWFLVAEPGNALIHRARRMLEDYWQAAGLESPGILRDIAGKVALRVLGRTPRMTTWWLSAFMRDRLRLYPYFAIHYSFAKAVMVDSQARRSWQSMTKVSADGPHQLQTYGLLKVADRGMLLEIGDPTTPMYKLTWKVSDGSAEPDSVLSLLISDPAARS